MSKSSYICITLLLSFFFSVGVFGSEYARASEQIVDTIATQEIIVINDISYRIPSPWAGNIISSSPLSMRDFRKIPAKNTKDGSTLYIVKKAQAALVQLLAAAQKDGIILRVESGYRSNSYQKKIFSRMLGEGRDFDDIIRYVAPPGYSQHALGTAVDFYPSNWRFANLPEYSWLKKNGQKFGFRETYPKNNTLHYPWEAWHWCYADQVKPGSKDKKDRLSARINNIDSYNK